MQHFVRCNAFALSLVRLPSTSYCLLKSVCLPLYIVNSQHAVVQKSFHCYRILSAFFSRFYLKMDNFRTTITYIFTVLYAFLIMFYSNLFLSPVTRSRRASNESPGPVLITSAKRTRSRKLKEIDENGEYCNIFP